MSIKENFNIFSECISNENKWKLLQILDSKVLNCDEKIVNVIGYNGTPIAMEREINENCDSELLIISSDIDKKIKIQGLMLDLYNKFIISKGV